MLRGVEHFPVNWSSGEISISVPDVFNGVCPVINDESVEPSIDDCANGVNFDSELELSSLIIICSSVSASLGVNTFSGTGVASGVDMSYYCVKNRSFFRAI